MSLVCALKGCFLTRCCHRRRPTNNTNVPAMMHMTQVQYSTGTIITLPWYLGSHSTLSAAGHEESMTPIRNRSGSGSEAPAMMHMTQVQHSTGAIVMLP